MNTHSIARIIRVFLFFTCLVFWIEMPAFSRAADISKLKPVVALDPGHGGAGFGARGPFGLLEKNAALDLARQTAACLQNSIRVIFTRTEDYDVALVDRVAAANAGRADAFISLHFAASPLSGEKGAFVFFPEFVDTPDPGGQGAKGMEEDLWETARAAHFEKSRRLARIICQELSGLGPELACQVRGYPASVLKGAAMPAVLVEVGHLTHPDTERFLSGQGINEVSAALCRAVKWFLAL